MTVLVIAANNLRRLVRERANLFFVFVLPLLLILVLGLTLGSDEPRIGIHVEDANSSGAQELIDRLEGAEGIEVVSFDGFDAATTSGVVPRRSVGSCASAKQPSRAITR